MTSLYKSVFHLGIMDFKLGNVSDLWEVVHARLTMLTFNEVPGSLSLLSYFQHLVIIHQTCNMEMLYSFYYVEVVTLSI